MPLVVLRTIPKTEYADRACLCGQKGTTRASHRSLRRASWFPCLAAPSLLPRSLLCEGPVCLSARSCFCGMQAFSASKSLTQ